MAAEPNSVTLQTTVALTGNNTGIVVPQEAIEQLVAGKRPPVLVNANGYGYRNRVGVTIEGVHPKRDDGLVGGSADRLLVITGTAKAGQWHEDP